MWVGADGRVERVNQAELEMLGRPSENVLGHSVSELHTDTAAVADLLGRLTRRETVRNYHLSVSLRGGPIKHLLVDANGHWEVEQFVHSRWFVRDITDRVKLEREILEISERERERIGHDLHDGLCQQLAAIEYQNETLAASWASVAPDAAAKAHEISALLRKAIDYTRELARGLSPNLHFNPNSLTAALQELAERTQRIFNRSCRFVCSTPISLKDEAAGIHLYRIAQEAVGNAIKHANASEIEIQLVAKEGELILGVKDNGIGLPARAAEGKGLGLRIMQYRAGALGGTLVIQHSKDLGTAVVCTVKNVLPQESKTE